MNPTAITNKINKAAAKYGPMDTRTVYKRTVSSSGGNVLIDRGVTQTVVDVAFVPQPLFKRSTAVNPVPTAPATSARQDVLTGTRILVPGDFEFLFTPVQMTTSAVADKTNIIVLKDGSGNEEQLQIVSYTPIILKGVEIGTSALYRSVSRQ